MDSNKFTRNASKIHEVLVELPDGKVVTTKGCKIYSPYRYSENNLSNIGIDNYILGIFSIVVDDLYYGVSLLNTMVPIKPTFTNKVNIDNDDYYEFIFSPGSTVFESTTLVKSPTLVYRIYDEFISKGNIPWYMGYEDLGHIFDSAKEFADANIGTNPEVTQLIASILARDSKDRMKYYRTSVESVEDLNNSKPVFVPLKSIQYQSTNTLTSIGGSYFQQGVTSALINPAQRSEKIESLLLK